MKRNRSEKAARSNGCFRLPDLDHAKAAVLSTLSSPDAQRSYRFAIDDFIDWYCSKPRLGFNKAAVLGYRLELEFRHLASSTINLRLAAVRRLAYEAADTSLMSPESAVGIRRVKGAKATGRPPRELVDRRPSQSFARPGGHRDRARQTQSSHPRALFNLRAASI
jgi:hypothetical protein